jgi:hypothetical protein
MLRRLRIAASVFFAVLAVAVCDFWVRSYRWSDEFEVYPAGNFFCAGISHGGRLVVGSTRAAKPPTDFLKLRSTLVVKAAPGQFDDLYSVVAGFGGSWRLNPPAIVLELPSWFALALTSALAVVSWPRRTYRFRLRAMLIATTAVAIVLGLIVWMTNR